MDEVVEDRVDDRRNGEYPLLCPYMLLWIKWLYSLVYSECTRNNLYFPVATNINF